MAKQTKKEKTKTSTKKKNTSKKNTVEEIKEETIEKIVEEQENTEDVQDISSIETNVDEMMESINSVDTELNIEKIENSIQEKSTETINEIKKATSKIEEFEASKNDFSDKIQKNPEDSQKIIEEEIKRTKQLKA